jgi:hypothetical protein
MSTINGNGFAPRGKRPATPRPNVKIVDDIDVADEGEDDVSGADRQVIVVDDADDAETLRGHLPGATVLTFDVLSSSNDLEVDALAEYRNVLIVLPYDAGPALIARTKDAHARLDRIAHETLVVSWWDWTDGTPLQLPDQLDTTGAKLIWLRSLPEVEAPATIEAPAEPRSNGKPAVEVPAGDLWPKDLVVEARDREPYNYGFIAADHGDGMAWVRFESPSGHVKTVKLPKSVLVPQGVVPKDKSESQEPEGPPPVYATLADAIAQIGDIRWVWPSWIPAGSMSLLAARAGEGKTRTCMELVRRLWYGLPWPDGSPNPFPAQTRTLWVLVDRNWQETADVAKSFGVPLEAILLNSLQETPLVTPDLDQERTIQALAQQIRDEQPALVIIDTITYATAKNTARAEEAKAAFDGIMQLAAETGVAILALAHLNREGEVLNRRITERARSVLSLSCPDPENQPDRRRFWVSKTAVKRPTALGVTFKDECNEFDDVPPEAPEEEGPKRRGPSPTKGTQFAAWLWDQLQKGPTAVLDLITAARDEGLLVGPTEATPKPSISPLYAAKDRLAAMHPGHVVDEFQAPVGQSLRALKHWRITATQASPGDSESNDDPVF